ncbi:ParB N-terminal domain-containing protein [Entomomonas sp. E2T0]|uniref:ParB family protein n=1 Tax=Entomomonas sp. E2T0 TaxID=2930213 RepID=UPI00222835E9|nr:ParB family protein [Entomomonas sp. E2T0]UYZ83109.1 ParB N-terminal domain-containing protein [Entomomonas sp. E2T0]
MNKKKPTAQDISKQMLASGFKSPNNITQLADPISDTPIELTLDQLRTYEHNPRKSINPLFNQIKESIRSRGLDHPPTVTKRPGEKHYIIRSGGNTRLKALKELYDETGDERFYRIKCLFKPWAGEITSMVGHLVENELHGELMFIDKAIAINTMRDFYTKESSKESGRRLSLRDIADYLKRDGYPISHSLVGRMLECVDNLLPAIPDLLYGGLGKPRIEELLTLKNAFKKIWNKYIQDNEPLDAELSPDNEMFLGFWTAALSKFNDIDAADFNLIRIKDEILQELTFYTSQDYTTLELDLVEATKSNKSTTQNNNEFVTSPVETHTTTVTNQLGSSVSHSQPQTKEPIAEPSKPTDKIPSVDTITIEKSTLSPVVSSTPIHSPVKLSDEDKQQQVQDNIIEPVSLSPKVQKINQDIDKQLGGDPLAYDDAITKSIPIQAGGGLNEVTDIWYIPKQIDSPEAIREELYQLAYDLATYGNYQDKLIRTNEGLGFGVNGQTITDKNEHTEAIAMLIMTLLRLHPDQAQADISLAIFNQLLMGGYDIAIGNNPATSIGIKPLPDVLLIKLFRLIRLTRRLIELINHNE